MFAYKVQFLRFAWNSKLQCIDLNSMIEINFPLQDLHPVQISLKSDQSFSSYSSAKFDLLSKLDTERPFWGWRKHQRQKSCFSNPPQLLISWRSYIEVMELSLSVRPFTLANHFLRLHKRHWRTCGEKLFGGWTRPPRPHIYFNDTPQLLILWKFCIKFKSLSLIDQPFLGLCHILFGKNAIFELFGPFFWRKWSVKFFFTFFCAQGFPKFYLKKFFFDSCTKNFFVPCLPNCKKIWETVPFQKIFFNIH